MTEIRSLTGLRGVAALWVLLFHIQGHAAGIGLPWLWRLPFAGLGWSAVDLFFILSGFVLMVAQGRHFPPIDGRSLRRFGFARILRIYPAHLVILAGIVALVRADPGFAHWYRQFDADNLSLAALARTALLATRWLVVGGDWNQPVWSLSVEIIGYAAFPLIAVRLGALRSAPAAIAVALSSLIGLAAYRVATGTGPFNDFGLLSALARLAFCFLAGAALARARLLIARPDARLANLLALAGAALILLVGLLPGLAILLPFGFALLIFGLSFEAGPLHALLASRLAMVLGGISYPLYLLHVMPLLWLDYRLHDSGIAPLPAAAVLLGYVLFCMTVAALLHHYVELPCQRWGKRRRAAGTARTALA